jgi:photosystem II stability/assembly factor-like uncharacterized protein
MFPKTLLRSCILLSLLLAACSPAAVPAPTAAPQILPSATAVAPTATVAPSPTSKPADTAAPSPTLPPPTPTAGTTAQASEANTPVAPAGPSIVHLSAGSPISMTTIHMLDANIGWGTGHTATDPNSHILQTADGGKTWRDVTPPQPLVQLDQYQAVGTDAAAFFLDAQQAWVAFGYGSGAPLSPSETIVVWATHDGGKSWTPSAPLDTASLAQYWPSNVVFVDNRTGWLMAHVGAGMSHDYVVMYATQDGGANWKEVVDPMAMPDTGSLAMSCQKSGIVFVDAKNGWVTGDCGGVVPGSPYLYQTTDGGVTWTFKALPAPADVPDLYNRQQYNACGVGAPVFVSANQGMLPVNCLLENQQKRGWLYVTADGGKTWTPRPLPATYGVMDFLDANVGWWAGNDAAYDPTVARQLYSTQDGGQTWTLVKQTLTWGGQLDFITNQTGWAVATTLEDTALVQTSDGGKKWNLLTPQIAP